MVLWRISLYVNLSGAGGEIADGRWHTAGAGNRIVYLADHPAVALIENLVSLDGEPRFFPKTFQLLRITAPEGLTPKSLTSEQSSSIRTEDHATTQAFGDAWLAARSSALLRVPSIPSPESWNYLLNPLHPDASLLKIEWARHISYDKRYFDLPVRERAVAQKAVNASFS
jgi:RES domain-containing protein